MLGCLGLIGVLIFDCSQMHNDHGLQFRGYVPVLMDLLEDADGMVRDCAKGTVIELFR